MARSSRIYVIHAFGELVGAFTVKHEMLSCAKRCNWPAGAEVTVIPDGDMNIPRGDAVWKPRLLESYQEKTK